jgi:hypothetical protein
MAEQRLAGTTPEGGDPSPSGTTAPVDDPLLGAPDPVGDPLPDAPDPDEGALPDAPDPDDEVDPPDPDDTPGHGGLPTDGVPSPDPGGGEDLPGEEPRLGDRDVTPPLKPDDLLAPVAL